MKKKNKKPIYVLILVAVILLVGGTIAYFTDTVEITNVFKTKPYSTEVTETFTSPNNWLPGTTTNKSVVAKNTGDVDVAVRMSYTESWKSANGQTLPLKQGNTVAAVINFNNTNWIKVTENGKDYYYYNTKLTKNQSSTSFINSVTFNSAIISDSSCQEQNVTGGITKQCTSTGNGYDGATYTMVVTVETAQYDSYRTIWGTNVTIN